MADLYILCPINLQRPPLPIPTLLPHATPTSLIGYQHRIQPAIFVLIF